MLDYDTSVVFIMEDTSPFGVMYYDLNYRPTSFMPILCTEFLDFLEQYPLVEYIVCAKEGTQDAQQIGIMGRKNLTIYKESSDTIYNKRLIDGHFVSLSGKKSHKFLSFDIMEKMEKQFWRT